MENHIDPSTMLEFIEGLAAMAVLDQMCIRDSNVTVQEGAAYVPTKDNGAADADYVKGDVFLKQGTVYTCLLYTSHRVHV